MTLPMIPQGVVRIKPAKIGVTGDEIVIVRHGDLYKRMTHFDYWCAGYEPPFGELKEIDKAQLDDPAVWQGGAAATPTKLRDELRSELQKAKERTLQAQQTLDSRRRWDDRLGPRYDDDAGLAMATVACMEERVALRNAEHDQLENSWLRPPFFRI